MIHHEFLSANSNRLHQPAGYEIEVNVAIKKAALRGSGLVEEEFSILYRFPTLALTRSGGKGCLSPKTLSRAAPLALLQNLNPTLRLDPCQLGYQKEAILSE